MENRIKVNKKKETIFQDVIVMLLITIVAGFLLGYVNEITKEPISVAAFKEKNQSYQKMFPTADDFEEKILESDIQEEIKGILKTHNFLGGSVEVLVTVKEKDEIKGYIITASSSNAYSGNITISLGLDNEGTIIGLDYITINETVGLGMNATEASFKDQFIGKDEEYITYVKGIASNKDEISAITSATVTTEAVVEAVNSGLLYFHQYVVN